MRTKLAPMTLVLVLALTALAILLGQASALPSTIAEGGRLDSLQPTSPSDTPPICWLSPGIRLLWPEGMDTTSLQLAYNSQADEFLALGVRYVTDWTQTAIVGLRLSPTGQRLSEPVTVIDVEQGTLPAVAYSPATQRYLVAYGLPNQPGEKGAHLEGQMLTTDLSPVGERFPISAVQGQWPAVTFNPDEGEFLVVWQDEREAPSPTQTPPPSWPTGVPTLTPTATGTPDPFITPTPFLTPTPRPLIQGIYAQRVPEDGRWGRSSVIPVVMGSTPEDVVGTPQVVYNARDHEYLVVWTRGGPEPGLYGRRLSRAGEPLGEAMRLTASPAAPHRPFLVYNGADNQYLVVWAEARQQEARLMDVYGLLLSAQGTPLGEPFLVRGTEQYEVPTGAVYNPAQNEYLVAWDMNVEGPLKPTLQRLSAQGAPVGGPIGTMGGVFGLAVNPAQGNDLVLEEFGYRARPLGFGSACSPTPTPAPDTPEPSPRVIYQWHGVIQDVFPLGGDLYHAEQWQVGTQSVIVTRLTRVEAQLGRAEVGAVAWVTAHELIGQLVADVIVILPFGPPTPTPPPTATATPTPDPANGCWLDFGTWIPWPEGTDTASLQLAYNAQNNEFVAVSARHLIEVNPETGEIIREEHGLAGARLSSGGQLLSGPTTIVSATISTYPALAYSPATNGYLLAWGEFHRWPYRGGSRLKAQMLAADPSPGSGQALSPIGSPVELRTTAGYPRLAVVYNPDDDEFLAGWTDEQPGPPISMTPIPQPTPFPTPTPVPGIVQGVYLLRVGGDGIPVESAIVLATKTVPPGGIGLSQIAYNPQAHEYLVIWGRSEADRHEVYAQRLSRSGERLGEARLLPLPPRAYALRLVYNRTDNQYLLLWATAREREGRRSVDVDGALLSAHGELQGQPFVVLGTVGHEEPWAAMHNLAWNEYLVLSSRNALQRLSAQGVPIGEPVRAVGETFVGLGVNQEGDYLVLAGHGYLARFLGFGSRCLAPTPTPPAEVTPVPVPEVAQWEGLIEDIHPLGDAARWRVGGRSVMVTRWTRVEESMGKAEVGAGAWVTAREQGQELVASDIVILAAGAPQPARHRVYLPYVARGEGSD